jgi:hypothetical protein
MKLFSTAFLSAFALYFFDWLFQRTGNMPLSAFEPSQAYLSLSSGILLFGLGFALAFAGAHLFSLVVAPLVKVHSKNIVHWIKILLTACALATALLLLMDNFQNTMWGKNIGDYSSTSFRYFYLIGFLSAALYFSYELNNLSKTSLYQKQKSHTVVAVVGLLAAIPSIFVTVRETLFPQEQKLSFSTELSQSELPNILFLQGDGLDASQLSVYGFKKQTTPFLDSIKDKVNIWTNFYPSNCCTYGAHYALLTGIHPLSTHVYYPPAQVPLEQINFSLPAALRKLGYKTYQDTLSYYADASFMGLTSSFKIGNETLEGQHPLKRFLSKVLPVQSMNSIRSTRRTVLRMRNNLESVFLNKAGVDGFDLVQSHPVAMVHPDDAKVARVSQFIESEKKPWFLQVHLMGTHGATFQPRSPFFSQGHMPQQGWHDVFYYDALRDWDSDVSRIFEVLKSTANQRETWVFVTSDHGMAWNSAQKIPLLTLKIDQHSIRPFYPRLSSQVLQSLHESIDLPLTVWRELRINQSAFWMQGRPLTSSDPLREVLNAHALNAPLDDTGANALMVNRNAEFPGVNRIASINTSGRVEFQELNALLGPWLNGYPAEQSIELLPPRKQLSQKAKENYASSLSAMPTTDFSKKGDAPN